MTVADHALTQIGTIGVWTSLPRARDRASAAAVAAELEGLGFGCLWIPGGAGGDLFGDLDNALAATERISVASAILNVWEHTEADSRAGTAQLKAAHPGRFVLGIGAGHRVSVDRHGPGTYRHPLAKVEAFIDGLAEGPDPVDLSDVLVAALGPKMLELARKRTGGSHPYLVTAEHTEIARAALGPDSCLAPELKVVLAPDRPEFLRRARAHLADYLVLPNYTNNMRRLGFTDEDLSGVGSERLCDRIVAGPDVTSVVARAQEHIDAGADHVCVHVLTEDRRTIPSSDWAELAPPLLESVRSRQS
jgi:probable F420-dependent oxidoreductase